MNKPNDTPLYQQLAADYGEAIGKGSLQTGSRMPSVRELMRRHEVSLSTALQALRVMEDRGWLEARPRIGYFVRASAPALAELADPDLRTPLAAEQSRFGDRFVGLNERISLVLDSARRAGVRVDLGGATPGPELFDVVAMNRSAVALLREQPELMVLGRATTGAHPEFQTAMARRALDAGVRLAPQDVLATSGNTEAVHLALTAVAQPGDVVAVESPTYYGLLQVIESQGLKSLEIPCSPRSGISLEALELAVRTEPRLKAVVVMPHLQMPLGTLMPDSHKAALVALCSEHGLALVEDDSYRLLLDSPTPPRPAKAWDVSGHVIYCESFNKTLAPGLRQGWMSAGRWHERVYMLKFAQSRNTAQWGQLLAARWASAPAFARHLQRLRTSLRGQREQAARAVARHFPSGTRLSIPPGGLNLWVELPPGASSSRLFEQALREGIRIAPGSMFSNTGRYDGFVRLGCTVRFTDEVEQAYRVLGRLLGKDGQTGR
ncbi:PLP-dependent aminotransferase family protein [Polaromonas sp.]|uniref:aminotransferase-like domain-containing protein n=1 Tax=Polaromonas sp. TaxID=1869339 RepID=UPI003266802A